MTLFVIGSGGTVVGHGHVVLMRDEASELEVDGHIVCGEEGMLNKL